MINDLRLPLSAFKFVDDTTIFDICKEQNQNLQNAATSLEHWSVANQMKINGSKTKELIICFKKVRPVLDPIVLDDTCIETVHSSKLLGVIISDDLTWDEHVSAICAKANGRVQQLYLLRRCGVSPKDLVLIYISTIRPVLEYAAAVWHPGLSKSLTNQIESIQKRVLRIVFPSLTYELALERSELPTLEQRRTNITRRLFKQIQEPSHKLHQLLPLPQPASYNLRNKLKFPLPKCKTSRFRNSFLPYCLFNFQ